MKSRAFRSRTKNWKPDWHGWTAEMEKKTPRKSTCSNMHPSTNTKNFSGSIQYHAWEKQGLPEISNPENSFKKWQPKDWEEARTVNGFREFRSHKIFLCLKQKLANWKIKSNKLKRFWRFPGQRSAKIQYCPRRFSSWLCVVPDSAQLNSINIFIYFMSTKFSIQYRVLMYSAHCRRPLGTSRPDQDDDQD